MIAIMTPVTIVQMRRVVREKTSSGALGSGWSPLADRLHKGATSRLDFVKLSASNQFPVHEVAADSKPDDTRLQEVLHIAKINSSHGEKGNVLQRRPDGLDVFTTELACRETA